MVPPRRGKKLQKRHAISQFASFIFNLFLCYAIYFWMKEKRDVKKLRKEREKPKSLKC